jgi:hypothetical protein
MTKSWGKNKGNKIHIIIWMKAHPVFPAANVTPIPSDNNKWWSDENFGK